MWRGARADPEMVWVGVKENVMVREPMREAELHVKFLKSRIMCFPLQQIFDILRGVSRHLQP